MGAQDTNARVSMFNAQQNAGTQQEGFGALGGGFGAIMGYFAKKQEKQKADLERKQEELRKQAAETKKMTDGWKRNYMKDQIRAGMQSNVDQANMDADAAFIGGSGEGPVPQQQSIYSAYNIAPPPEQVASQQMKAHHQAQQILADSDEHTGMGGSRVGE